MRGLRGISPVVATALLVVIAIATAALLYLWVSGTVSNQPTEEPAMHERIKIESVSYDKTNKQVTVYVRNVGTVTATVDAIYVIDAVNGTVVGSKTDIDTTQVPGNVTEYNVGLDGTLTPGRPYIVKAVTKDGVEASYTLIVRE